MSPTRKLLQLVSFLALLLLVAGCGGFNARETVSPIDFLLPGAGGLIKADPAPVHPDSDRPNPAEKPLTQLAKI